MKTHLDCIPCFIHHALALIRTSIQDDETRKDVLHQVLSLIKEAGYNQTPPEIARQIHHLIYDASCDMDPYRSKRYEQNQIALELVPKMRSFVQKSADPWYEAVKLSIAGNAIDLGVYHQLSRGEIERTFSDVMKQPIDRKQAYQMKKEVEKANSILYIGDNAGEIVFDMLLIEQMPREKVCFVVRGGPIINDVLLEDAQQVGLTELVDVIDSGSDIPGIVLDDCSDEFRKRFNNADLIIGKGQGNYETLNYRDKNIFILFKIKCPVIADVTGVGVGEFVIYEVSNTTLLV